MPSQQIGATVSTGEVRRSSGVLVAEFIAKQGEGGKFTKLQMNEAVPNYSQTDRRMRDLRQLGWVIDNYKVNPTLKPDEYLVQKIGVRIDLGEKPPKPLRKSIGGAKRRRILERDGQMCVVCGVPAGQPFPDVPERRAVLTIGHIIPFARGGTDDESNLRAECQRCGDESRDNTVDPPTPDFVLTRARNVGGRKEKERLAKWMLAGRKSPDDTELVFLDWCRLPNADRLRVMQEFSLQVLSTDDK